MQLKRYPFSGSVLYLVGHRELNDQTVKTVRFWLGSEITTM